MNQLYQQMMQNSPQNNQLKQMINLFKSNPQQAITNLMQNNPQTQQIMNAIRQSGKSPKQLFYELAKQKGVDPNQILNLFR